MDCVPINFIQEFNIWFESKVIERLLLDFMKMTSIVKVLNFSIFSILLYYDYTKGLYVTPLGSSTRSYF